MKRLSLHALKCNWCAHTCRCPFRLKHMRHPACTCAPAVRAASRVIIATQAQNNLMETSFCLITCSCTISQRPVKRV